MNTLFITDYALFDIEEATLYYESVRKGLSLDFELCIEAVLDEIINYLESFQKKYKHIRIRFIKRFPFGIHYIYEKNTIKVIGVFHTSRSSKSWKNRHE
ncbi:MAG: type II toxin-antitoxin system RelE/ParE family toxin [Flavobacteriales bacterium]|nr:type II toxin-antitoxin system RelE/ParE family toxin [Flavobacteriales bacterium]